MIVYKKGENMERVVFDEERIRNLPDNAMLKVKSELLDEWDFERNKGIDIYKVTQGQGIKVWWICPKCSSEYDSTINNRCRGHNCPYCAGLKVNDTNSLEKLRPDLVEEWIYDRNDKTPSEVTCGSPYEAWWKCDQGHEYKTSVSQRNLGTGCGYCSGKHVWIGFNDMNTTNTELASQLLNKEDGYKYSEGSKQRVDWKCRSCNEVIHNKIIMIVKNEGLKCPNCSDTKPYGERFMNFLLRQLGIQFKWDEANEWSIRKRYDFYFELDGKKIIVETHGNQHNDGSFESLGGRTLAEEINNDQYKYELAMKNDIDSYIVIDCKYSKFEYIKNSIVDSKLSEIFDLTSVNWDEINIKLNKNLIENVASEWNNGNFNSKSIATLYKITHKRCISILEKATQLNLCNYSKVIDVSFSDRVLLKLDDDLNVVEKLHMDSEDFIQLGYDEKKINYYSNNLSKYKGYYWCREGNYKNYIKRVNKKRKEREQNKLKRMKPIVQLDLNGELVRVWSGYEEILNEHEDYTYSTLNYCLNLHAFTYKNYIWLYKKFYNSREGKKYIKENLKSNKIGNKKRGVLQIDPNTGEVICSFDSIVEAVDKFKLGKTSMQKCLDRKRKTTGGYMWIREKEYESDEGKHYIEDLVKWYNSK